MSGQPFTLYINLMKNKFLLLFGLSFCLLLEGLFCFAEDFTLPEPTKDEYIYFTADQAVYDKENSIVAIKGNAEIYIEDGISSTRVIKSDDIQVYIKEQILVSQGKTVIEDEKGIFTSDGIKIDLASKAVIMENISADYPPIRVLSTKSIQAEDNKYILKKANITCCNYEKPHYTLYVGKADLIPNDRIWAVNAVVKIGKVPVFYLPFMYRSLNTDRLFTTYVDFDQSDNTGFGFLTSTVYAKNNFVAKANLDYYTRSGFGYGAEIGYEDPQKFRGSLQAYTIYDKVEKKQRWGVDGGYWWEVADTSDSLNKGKGAIYFSQFETRNVSDADFNDDFFRSNPYVVSPDKLTRISAVRQSNSNTLRIGYTNRDELNPDDKTYFNAEEYAPKTDWIFNPFTVKGTGGIVNNFAIGFNNAKLGDYNFVQYLNADWKSSKSFKLHPNFTLTPSGYYKQDAILKDPTNNDEDTFVSRYGGEVNLRSNLKTGLLDIGYRYTKRSTGGSLTNSGSGDTSEEENLIYIQNYYMLGQNFYFKLGSGYDLRKSDESWQTKYRIEPVLGEIGYFSPLTGASFYLQDIYDVHSANQAFVLDSIFKSFGDSYANFGITNYSTDRDTFLFTTKFLIAPKNWTWRADMGIDISARDSHVGAYSKHIKIYKDFHDIGIMVGVRDRNQNLSFSFRINVYCGKGDNKQIKSNAELQSDKYWRPWRDEGMIRDNF